MNRYSLLCLLLAFQSSSASNLAVSYGMGEATADNRIYACTLAENRAMKDALMNYAEQQFSATNQNVCVDSDSNSYCSYIREIDSSTSGTIRQVLERVKRVAIDTKTCFAEVKVEIEPATQLPVDVSSQRFYREGDPISVEIDVDTPLYLHVLNFHEQGVDILFPNKYTDETLIDSRFKFPPEGINMNASTGGKSESKETLLFLFTKRRQDIVDLDGEAIKDLLESIPVNEKRLISHNIVIRSE